MADPKIAALLLGMPKKGMPAGGDDDDPDVAKSRKIDAAKQFLDAVSSKDPEALAEAFHGLSEACEEYAEADEKAEGESDEG